MKKRKKGEQYRIVCVFIMVCFFGLSLFSCKNKALDLEKYPTLIKQLAYELDDSVAFSGPNDTELLSNPNRGFRGEVYITLGRNKAYPGGNQTAMQRLDSELSLYESDGIRILQVYVYLIEYYDRRLPDEALSELKNYFEELQSRNVRMLLRFAYEYDNKTEKKGPTDKIIEQHCKQLKEFFVENDGLINDTLFAVQMGMIGLWGEGHTAVKRHDTMRVLSAVCDMVPERYTLMVRYPKLIEKASKSNRKRLTLHDDFIVGVSHNWGLGIAESHKSYQDVINIMNHHITDGEMPWGSDNTVPHIDYLQFAKRIAEYGLTTLSITHNYKENAASGSPGYHLERWKSAYLEKAVLESEKLPYNPYMLDDGGKISTFDYIKYHLGYLIAASNASFENGQVKFMLTNFGLASPYDFSLYVKIDGGDAVKIDGFSPLELNQFGQWVCQIPVQTKPKKIEIALLHDFCDGLNIKLANDIPFDRGTGYNVINF